MDGWVEGGGTDGWVGEGREGQMDGWRDGWREG